MGRLDLAEPLYREDYEASVRTLGEEHPDTLVSATNLGGIWVSLGRFADAAPLLEKTVATSKRVLEPGFYGTAFALCAWGESLAGLERHAEAELALLEAYDILLAAFGPDDPNLDEPRAALIRLYEETGRSAEAQRLRASVSATGESR